MSTDCTCPSLDCGAPPAGFSRLRYFFGKRLQVADFVDEQRYHAGKQRMHNQLLHGGGVVCGLGASVFEPDWPGGGGDSTVLRIGKGVALDPCGREIVVGWDQCIDVDAWYRRVRDAARDEDPDADPSTLWPADVLDGDRLALCVVLRYRECPASPEPAPRDPCSCDQGGADYGRVREEFTLELVVRADLEGSAGGPGATPVGWPAGVHPASAALAQALTEGGPGAANLARALAEAITAGCPAPVEGEDRGLVLVCFQAVISTDLERVERIEELELATPILYSTALLQELLLRELAAGLEADALIDGPAIASIALAPDDPTGNSYTLTLGLTGPVVAGVVPGAAFALRRLDPAGGWETPAGAVTTAYQDTPAPALVINIANADAFLADSRSYRLTLTVDPATPIVDAELRPLRPLRFSHHFALSGTPDALALVPVPRPA